MARILVVDDDPLFSAMMHEDLLREGHRPLIANSAAEVLELLSDGVRVDLIVTDVLMPHMDGIQLIQALRVSHPALPIIAVSSGGDNYNPYIFTTARLLGADCVLRKPVCRTAMRASLHRLLHAQAAFVAETDTNAIAPSEDRPDSRQPRSPLPR